MWQAVVFFPAKDTREKISTVRHDHLTKRPSCNGLRLIGVTRAARYTNTTNAATGERVTERRQEPDKENIMKLIITANTWEEEVRNTTLHTLSDNLTLNEYKVVTGIIARAIARNDLEHATIALWTYSGEGYNQEHAKSLIKDLRETYEQNDD